MHGLLDDGPSLMTVVVIINVAVVVHVVTVAAVIDSGVLCLVGMVTLIHLSFGIAYVAAVAAVSIV